MEGSREQLCCAGAIWVDRDERLSGQTRLAGVVVPDEQDLAAVGRPDRQTIVPVGCEPVEVSSVSRDHVTAVDRVDRELLSGRRPGNDAADRTPREPMQAGAVRSDGVEHVRQEGRMISILASRNVDALVEQARSLPDTSVERFPVTLKEIFLEHVRNK